MMDFTNIKEGCCYFCNQLVNQSNSLLYQFIYYICDPSYHKFQFSICLNCYRLQSIVSKYPKFENIEWYKNLINHTICDKHIIFHIKDYFTRHEPIYWLDTDENGNTYESDDVFDDFDSLEIIIKYPIDFTSLEHMFNNDNYDYIINHLVLLIKYQIALVDYQELTNELY